MTGMSDVQRERLRGIIWLRTADFRGSFVVDLVLERDGEFGGWKIEYPVILQFRVVKLEDSIYSLTKSLSLDKHFRILNKIGEGSFA